MPLAEPGHELLGERFARPNEQVFYYGMDRRHELIILAHSMAAMAPNQLALRREEAIWLLEELTELQGRHDALVAGLRRLVDDI